MNFKFIKKIGWGMFCSTLIFSCVSVKEKFRLFNNINITDKIDNCIGHHTLVYNNKYNECIYLEEKCLGNDRGSYCAYSKCEAGDVDTILYLEFKVNPDFKYRKSFNGHKHVHISDYIYIADGRALFKEWHFDRYPYHPFLTIYIQSEPTFKALYGQLGTINPGSWGDQHYWAFGREEGEYNNGKRTGTWTFSKFTFYESSKEKSPLFFKEVSSYKDGVKHGLTKYLGTQDSTLISPPRWTDIRNEIPYENGKIDGWVKNWDNQGVFIDSVLYRDDQKVK